MAVETMWVAMRMQPWSSVSVHGRSVSGDFKVEGSSGFLLCFDDYQTALVWANGNPRAVQKVSSEVIDAS